MAAVAERFLGMPLDYLGHIEHDDTVWLTVRRRQPLLIDSPTSKSARNIERVARRILALLAAQSARPAELAAPPPRPRARKGPTRSTRCSASRAPRPTTRSAARTSGSARSSATGGLAGRRVVDAAALRARAGAHRRGVRHAARSGAPPRLRPLDLPRRSPASRSPPRARRSAAAAELLHAPGRARARDRRRDRVHRARSSARCASRQGIELADIAQRTKISRRPPRRDRGRDARRPARAGLRAGLRADGREVPASSTRRRSSKTYMRRLREDAARAPSGSVAATERAGTRTTPRARRPAAISRFTRGDLRRSRSLPAALRRARVGARAGVGRALLRLRRAAHRRRARLLRRRDRSRGGRVWHPWCHYPVGYSAFLGAFYRVFGERPARRDGRQRARRRAARARSCTASRATRSTPRRARVAAASSPRSRPGSSSTRRSLMTEPLAALGSSLAAWLFARATATPPPAPRRARRAALVARPRRRSCARRACSARPRSRCSRPSAARRRVARPRSRRRQAAAARARRGARRRRARGPRATAA